MQFSFDWLCDYVDPGTDVTSVAARLTAAGLSVEGQQSVGGDVILDVDVTTNRPDCMCHLGLAREVAALLGRPLRAPSVEVRAKGVGPGAPARVAVDVPVDCPRYVARIVRGVRVAPSPEWLVRRLEAIGQRPINNLVDITNFTLWELGQPIHAFDLKRLAESRIVVRRARDGERLTTLDGEHRRLDPEVLVIADAERAVALAGIMGGIETEVSEATVDVLIESAHFDPSRVRIGARRLGMHTDASHRFERGADPQLCRLAADRVAALMVEIAGGQVEDEAADVRAPHLDWRLRGRLELERAERLAGIELDAEQVERWLAAVGFELELESAGVWTVTAPSWRFYDLRPDPTRSLGEPQGEIFEADLFEEILRLHGFEGIPSTLPAVGGPDAGSSSGHWRREDLRRQLAACGYVEAVNFAFHDNDSESRFPALARHGEPLRLANPVSELLAVMRRSLLPGLVAAAEFNQRRGAKSVRLFEIGHVFPGTASPEVEVMAIVAGGVGGSPWNRSGDFDLFDLKGVVESLSRSFGVALRFEAVPIAGLVPGTASRIVAGPRSRDGIGHLGQLEVEAFAYPLYAVELYTSKLEPAELRAVRLPSRFPAVEVDLTLTHALDTSWAELEREIVGAAVEDLLSFGLKDRYRGPGVPEGAVNTTIYFLYNADDRSLTQDEVNRRHEAVRQRLERQFGWKGST